MKHFEVEFITSAVTSTQYPDTGLKEIVLSGRSNVGKSSFINSILNKKKLAYTSSKPGKTQTLNFFEINKQFYFVDVPGYGYAKVSKQDRIKFGQMIEEYLTTREELALVVLLIDFRHMPTEDDLLMYDFVKSYGIKTIVVATKVDKIPKTKRFKQEKLIKQHLNLDHEDEFITYSSVTLENKEKILNYLLESVK